MIFIRKYIDDLNENYQKVIVNVQYAHINRGNRMIDQNQKIDYRIIDCFIPAEARLDKNKNIIIKYETCHNYDIYTSYSIYNDSNCPLLYDFYKFDLRSTMLMALGILLGYDEADDCLKPFLEYKDEEGKDFYRKWWTLEPLYDSFKNANGEKLKDSKRIKNISCFR